MPTSTGIPADAAHIFVSLTQSEYAIHKHRQPLSYPISFISSIFFPTETNSIQLTHSISPTAYSYEQMFEFYSVPDL